MARECMLTTVDNPFDYFTQFKSWFNYDIEKGYYTCAYLARIAKLREDMSEQEENEEIERAIDEILTLNPLSCYLKVFKQSQANQ